jgi:hypothetical protein
MTNLKGMPDPELVEALRKKWGLDNEPNEARASTTAIILENQEKHFTRLVEETRALSVSPLQEKLFPELKAQLPPHLLHDLCGIQPMTGPTGDIYFYRPQAGETEETILTENGVEKKVKVPIIALDIVGVPIHAESRRAKAYRQHDREFMQMMIEELLTEIAREVLGTMLNGMLESSTETVEEGVDLNERLSRAAMIVWRKTQRGPANRIIANDETLTRFGFECPINNGQIQEICGADKDRRVYMDPYFPKGQLMTWYQGESCMDTGLIFSPYLLFEITPNFVDPADMTLRRSIRMRHKITLVRPEFAYLLKLASD